MNEARPTEYRGKLYKSKTEAMFAMVMNYYYERKSERIRLIYELEKYKTPSGYIPDFELTYVTEPFLADFTTLIEVKPSIPTQVYLDYLFKQFRWIREKDYFHNISWYCLYVFNPYDKIFLNIGFDVFDNKPPLLEDLEHSQWFTNELFDIALKYRFDLEPDF